ncbi:MAG: hypothetical protein K8I82_21140 [Anaerolineae bacterium]|nr:hypothetical protein [Anaerolineae bacterium]
MKIIEHIFKQPFIVATGLAALVHSTWALGTLFSGKQPQDHWQLAGWLLPAFLIAFALDVGQIVTSAEIRTRGLTWQRGITFTVFAAATYYLQWLYIAHHMPALDLAAGVRAEWTGLTGLIRDAALWMIPALLPLSTLLYTLSSNDQVKAPAAPAQTANPGPVLEVRELLKPITPPESRPKLSPPAVRHYPDWFDELVEEVESTGDDWFMQQLEDRHPEIQDEKHVAKCPSCGWERSYDSAASAAKGYGGHMKHCPAIQVKPERNGNHVSET